MDRITILNGLKYSITFKNNLIDLYSLDKDKYPNILGLTKADLSNAYQVRIWILARGCKALYLESKNGSVKLDVRPSEDVITLGAKQIERGVYHAEIPAHEVERIWEERSPYLDFPFPLDFETEYELNLNEFRNSN